MPIRGIDRLILLTVLLAPLAHSSCTVFAPLDSVELVSSDGGTDSAVDPDATSSRDMGGADGALRDTSRDVVDVDQSDDFRRSLLDRRVGFGREAGSGALGWPVFEVTSLADSGPGSLRLALSDSRRWIRFAPVLNGEIELGSPLEVPGDVVVDGRGASIELTGPSSFRLLELRSVQNVILTNLRLSGGDDGVFIRNGCRDIWIDHITASGASDEVISITAEGGSADDRPDLITLSFNRIEDSSEAMLLGSTVDDPTNAPDRVTIHHNHFLRNNASQPRVRFARVHAFNNWFEEFGSRNSGDAVRVGAQGQFFSEANIFDDLYERPALIAEDSGTEGFVRAKDDVVTGSPTYMEASPERVFDPTEHYDYAADSAGPGLRTRLEAEAGWRD